MVDKRAIVFGSYAQSLLNFRKNLLMDLVASGYKVVAVAPEQDEAIVRGLNDIGVEFRSVYLSRTGLSIWGDLKTIRSCYLLMRQVKPDLLITYTIKPVIYGNLVAGFYSKIKTVALITGLGYLETGEKKGLSKLIQKGIFQLYRIALRKLNYIAYQNPDDQHYFKDNNLLLSTKTAMTITAGSGVDLSYYQRKIIESSSPVVFLFIARLIRAKGILDFIEAAARLKKKYDSQVIFRVIGLPDPGNPDSVKESELNQAISEGIIEYLGHQQDVRPHIANASVFVLPSYYREGTPRTILESLAIGRAIITTDNPGCRETVTSGVNGYLVPVKDAMRLEHAMEAFVINPVLIKEMGNKSYEAALNRYDVKKVNKALFAFADI